MNLRLRSLALVAIVLAFFLAGLTLLYTSYTQRSQFMVIHAATRRAAETARDLLGYEIQRIDTVAQDWALWRGLADYVAHRDPSFANQEFTDTVLRNLRVDAFMLRGAGGEALFTAEIEDEGRIAPMSADDIARWSEVAAAGGAARSGLVNNQGPWLVSDRPIRLGGGDKGASGGHVLFAIQAGERLAARLTQLLRFPVDLIPLSETSRLHPRLQRAMLAAQPTVPVELPDPDLSGLGAVLLPDINGQPALILQIRIPAPGMTGIRIARMIAVAVSGMAGLLFAAAVLIFLYRRVFRQLHHLSGALQQVRQRADFGARVTLGGTPEMVNLGAEINGLLDTMQRVHDRLEHSNRDLERKVAEGATEMITHRAMERTASEQDRMYHTLFDMLPTGILLLAEDGVIMDVNPALCQIFGYTHDELLGQSVSILVPEDRRWQMQADLKRLLGGETLVHEVINHRRDGSVCHMMLREKAITMANGERRIVVNADDITSSFEASNQLQLSERRYHELFNGMISGLALLEPVCDPQGQPVNFIFLDVNSAFSALTGVGREQAIGRQITEVFQGLEPVWIERYSQAVLSGKPLSFDSYAAALGKYFSVTVHNPQPGQVAVNFVDITEKKKVEERLRLQGTAMESSVNGIMIVNREGIITWVNRTLTQLTGYSADELVGHSPRMLKSGRHNKNFYANLWNTVLDGRMWRGELINRKKDGTLYLEEMTITPAMDEHGEITHLVGIKQDITERHNLQQQLFQAQKMEGIGRLAGGIAHDFNNLLQAITGFTSILLNEMAPDSPHRADVLEIERAAHRAADLTRQMLAFSRRQMIEPRMVDANALVENLQKMLKRLIGEDIALVIDLAPNLDPVRVDPGQIEQVLVNLAVNARDAMPNGGRLTISTYDLVFLKEDTLLVPEARHGRFVCLAMSDTGTGISPDDMEHIFEPFFSTKGPGKGTGLGLSVVYGIIRQHDGMVHVYSQLGMGTTFRIYLPIFEESGMAPVPAVARDDVRLAPPAPGTRILLVEDEDGVRDFAIRALISQGYDVLAAPSAEEARELFRRENGRFDILFTDVVLADGSGIDLADELLPQRPGLHLLFTSGYMDDKSRWPVIRERGYRFLQKPYPVQDLLRAIQDALTA